MSIFLKRTGYQFTGVTDPMEAIERVRNEHFDLMILDFIMTPFHGDQVVEEIRKFNKDLYILLLTGHKDLAPPLETIKIVFRLFVIPLRLRIFILGDILIGFLNILF